jgi:hypothetical protein
MTERPEGQAMTLETILVSDLDRVCGGFDAGRCFDDVWPWAAGGAVAGSLAGPKGAAVGALGGAGAGFLASPNCGNGTKSPATLLREGITQPSPRTSPRPLQQGR